MKKTLICAQSKEGCGLVPVRALELPAHIPLYSISKKASKGDWYTMTAHSDISSFPQSILVCNQAFIN
mgnify:CR=1 FL=1